MLSIVASALLAFAPGTDPQPAAEPAPAAAAAPAVVKEDDPVVCRNQVVAGSRLPVKVCQRQSEISARKRSGRDAVDKLQLNNGMRGPKS